MERKTIYFSGLAKPEQILLEAYINMLVLRDGSRFCVVDTLSDAQIEVFDPNLNLSSDPAASARTRIAYVNPADGSEHAISLVKPVRLSNLREVLGSICSSQHTLPVIAKALPAHRKLEHWLEVIAQLEGVGGSWQLNSFDDLSIQLHFGRKQVLLSDEKKWPTQLFQAGRDPKPIASGVGPISGGYMCSLDYFRWQLCSKLGVGLLLPGISNRRTFSILQWPDFGKLGGNADHMKLSALFFSRESSVTRAAAITGLPVITVIDFLNGCAVLGLLKNCPSNLFAKVQSQAQVFSETASGLMQRRVDPKNGGGFSGFLGKLRSAFGLTKTTSKLQII